MIHIIKSDNTFTKEQLEKVKDSMNRFREFKGLEQITELLVTPKTVKPVQTSDHQPCQDCGNTVFLRTGTCHVCQTCGASQGCS